MAAYAEVTVTPVGQYVTVKGDSDKFREDVWLNDGWGGGGEFTLRNEKLAEGVSLDLAGRIIVNEEDYALRLEIAKPDVAYFRAGYTQYRRYFDATGGFFRSFSTQSFTPHGDPHLDVGNVFFEVGLTLPDLPKITLGYENQFRDGTKSMLEWGSVTEAGQTRKIFPSTKDVDERVDIFKVSVEHEIKGVRLADHFRYERFETDTRRLDGSANLTTGARQTISIREKYEHDAFFNTFVMDSHLKEHIYWSLGHLYTTLSGDARLNLVTTPFVGANDRNWVTRAVDVGTDSHVVNVNTLFGPYRSLTIYAGVQAEKTESDGFTDALLRTGPNTLTNRIHSTNDKRGLQETFGLRYVKIPFTTLYAEGRWTQQQYDLNERDVQFQRKTDADVFRQDYRVGFNTSPIRRVNLAGRYRYAMYNNDYTHEVDTEPGYPAFITAQDFTTEEVMAKLTLRPHSKISAAFTYQLVATDIETGTAAIPAVTPRGSLTSGNYDAHIYSASLTVTPMARLFLSGLFSYQDTRTVTFANGAPSVIEYKGNVYTAVGVAGYALDNKTDLTVEYSYSRSDNFRDNSADGLPLGIDYQRHGLIAGISRKISENVTARFRYGWYQYNETSNGGINDYTAQLASASCSIRF